MSGIGRLLIFLGVGIAVVGGIILLLERLPGVPLGRLPGDFSWKVGNVNIYVPIVTMIVVSIVLTILVNLFLKVFR